MTENEIGKIIVDRSLIVHQALGPGLLESAYEMCLAYELSKFGLLIERQKTLPLKYNDVDMDCGYRVDLLVEKSVIIEIKTVDSISNVHLAQVLTYLKLSQCKLGYLINFNVKLLKNGIKRVVLNL